MADDICFDRTTTTKLKPWAVPSFVVVEDDANARTISNVDLPDDVFDLIVQAFVTDAYASVQRAQAVQISMVAQP